MSLKQIVEVWSLDLPHPQAWVLQAMADHADDEGRHVYPSIARLAWKTNYSERQVQRIIGQLRDRGIIEMVADADPTISRPAEYRLHLDRAPRKPTLEEWRLLSRAGRRGSHEANTPGDKMSPPLVTQLRHPPGDMAMSPEPSINRHPEKDDSKGRAKIEKLAGRGEAPQHRPPAPHRLRTSSYIEKLAHDLSIQLGDEVHTASNVTRALRLWNRTELREEMFAKLMYDARARTQRAKTRPLDDDMRTPMAYYFAVLEDLINGGT